MTQPAPVYINGEFKPAAGAHVSVFDLGFQFGDGVYEVVSAMEGVLFRLDDHVERLMHSLHATRIDPKMNAADWREAMIATARMSGLRDIAVKTVVSRGVPPPGASDPRAAKPNVFMTATPYLWLGNEQQRAQGIKLQIAHQRGMPPDTLDPRYKHISRLQYQLAKIESIEAGYDDLIWLAHDGSVQEAPKSNLFVVKKGVLYTADDGILHGITRMTLCELARELGIPLEVRSITPFDLFTADEAFLCSTSGGALPVREVAGRPMMRALPGTVTQKLDAAYWRIRREGRYGTPIAKP
ncbi:MAG: aminotransferase class IV [Burkholderiales bacterium]